MLYILLFHRISIFPRPVDIFQKFFTVKYKYVYARKNTYKYGNYLLKIENRYLEGRTNGVSNCLGLLDSKLNNSNLC